MRCRAVQGFASLLFLVGVSQPVGADPARSQQEGWTKTDFSKSRVSRREILSGDPPKDGIPSVDDPMFKSVTEDKELTPSDLVIELAIGGNAQAYPLRILIWHEIVDHTVADVPVSKGHRTDGAGRDRAGNPRKAEGRYLGAVAREKRAGSRRC
jgi:hypothetical protein